MSEAGAHDLFEVSIAARNDELHPDDDRWADQQSDLMSQLQHDIGTLSRGSGQPGAKGGADTVIVALGSAGAFSAMVECFRAWLGRDHARRIDVRWDENGVERHVTLTGEGLDTESVRDIAKAAADRVGGQPWPASTERS